MIEFNKEGQQLFTLMQILLQVLPVVETELKIEAEDLPEEVREDFLEMTKRIVKFVEHSNSHFEQHVKVIDTNE